VRLNNTFKGILFSFFVILLSMSALGQLHDCRIEESNAHTNITHPHYTALSENYTLTGYVSM
jgi:hypothetical protein